MLKLNLLGQRAYVFKALNVTLLQAILELQSFRHSRTHWLSEGLKT